MRDVNLKPCIIFAMPKEGQPEPQSKRKELLEIGLGVNLLPLRGSDGGPEEEVWLAQIETEEQVTDIILTAANAEQEYIILISSQRHCAKLYLQGENRGVIEEVGKLVGVTEAEAKRHGSYTTNGETYWVAI